MGRYLAAQFAADGAAAACYKDGLALDEGKDLLHVDFDGLTAQKVLNGHFLYGACIHDLPHLLIKHRDLPELTACFAADTQKLTLLLESGAGYGQDYLLYLVIFHCRKDIHSAAHHGYAFQIAVPLVGVIVNDAVDPVSPTALV